MPYKGTFTVLEGLFAIQEHHDGSLCFRYCCRAAVCGSCAMYINGRYRLAQTNVSHLGSTTSRSSPCRTAARQGPGLGRHRFFAKYEYIKAWLMRSDAEPEREIPQSPRERRKLDMPIDCILCGCCYSSCPSVWYGAGSDYLGPAALLKAYRFEVDSRDQARRKAAAPVRQRARRVPLPHDHQLHRGLPPGAEPDRGHPVAQGRGRAPASVRPPQVAGGGRRPPGRAAQSP